MDSFHSIESIITGTQKDTKINCQITAIATAVTTVTRDEITAASTSSNCLINYSIPTSSEILTWMTSESIRMVHAPDPLVDTTLGEYTYTVQAQWSQAFYTTYYSSHIKTFTMKVTLKSICLDTVTNWDGATDTVIDLRIGVLR